MPSSIPLEIARLVLGQRWGAVAILEAGAPVGSMVAYASEPGLDTVVFFIISQLSAHARSMLQRDARVSLAITTPDTGQGDPQLLPRVSLQRRLTEIPSDTTEFEAAGATHVERFPDAAMRFQLGNFKMLRFADEEARYVATPS